MIVSGQQAQADALGEHSRLDALHALRLLDTPPEERFDRVVRLAQQLFGVAIVGVNLVDAERVFTKSAFGMAVGSRAREGSMCAATIAHHEDVLIVPDLLASAEHRDHPAAVAASPIRFYAGAVLRASGGERVGSLCLADYEPRELTTEQAQALRDLADLLENELTANAEVFHAREMQRRLLPQRKPDLPGLEVAGFCLPSRHVGGDFFDWKLVHGQLRFSLADVMGKGLSAALLAAGMRTLLRGISAYNGLAESVTRCGIDIQEDLTDAASFITLFTAQVDPYSGRFEYVDAGHGLAFVVSPDGSCRRLISDGLPVGTIPDDHWIGHSDVLEPGETLIAVSDGVLDASPDLDSAMRRIAETTASSRDVERAVDLVTFHAFSHSNDDITAVAVRRTAQ